MQVFLIYYKINFREKEAESGQVAPRKQGEGDMGAMSIADFCKHVQDEVEAMLA